MYDVAVVGAGILGLATARELLRRDPGAAVVVLEREDRIAAHQTGHNSGVIHAGIYYTPGSLKARLCVAGARELYEFCDEHGVRYERCGKLIVAVDDSELARLDELERRARANEVPGLRRLGAGELRAIEPEVAGVAGLHSPNTGIVDFGEVAGAYGEPAEPRIVPFRGGYMKLREHARGLVRGLIYPVPDPSLPFLGVHLTKTVHGEVWLGPSALLAPSRTAYRLSDVSRRDLGSTLRWPGSWRMFRRWWRTGLSELYMAADRRAFVRACARYVPAVTPSDVEPGPAGIRAQAVGRDGTLLDDFAFAAAPGVLHVRNAPSPAATSSLAIAKVIADRLDAAR